MSSSKAQRRRIVGVDLMDSSSRYVAVSWFWFSFFVVVQAAYQDGDVIIGGLFNVHQLQENSKGQCGELDMKGLGRAQAMIFTIDTINKNSKLLPNITLGYDIRDYCENVTKATQVTYELVQDKCCSNETRKKLKIRNSIMALIGPYESRTALVIGGFLQMLNVPAVSGTTTSPELSSHYYKHLYRTAPSDSFLAKAMTDIIEHFNWTYVAAVGLDDSYGRNGVWSVVKEAATRKSSFCIAMTEFIPIESQFPSIREIVTSLRHQENIKVVILWAYGSYQRNFFNEVNRQKLTGRVWIISTVSSFTLKTFARSGVFTMNGSIAFQPNMFYDAGFKEHMTELLTNESNKQIVPEWWSEVRALTRNCSANSSQHNKLCIQSLVDDMYSSFIPYVIDAVYSVAHAFDIGLAEYKNITDNFCDVQKLMSKVRFVGLTGNVAFDDLGDTNSAVYEIIKFQQVHGTDGKRQLKQAIVGKWETNGQNINGLRFYGKIHWNTASGSPPKSECLDQCQEGTRKSTTSPCCWQCVPCPRGTINTIPGSQNCIECPSGKRSNQARTKCVDLPLVNMKYSTAGGIVILAFVALGIVVTIFSFAVFYRFWNTPIVNASNKTLSLGILAIVLSLLSLALMNLFEPTDTICKIIYPWRYITYNLCLSLLLVKVFRISSAFRIPMTPFGTIYSLTYRMQVVIVTSLQVILLIVLLPWLLLDHPISKKHIVTEHYIFIECNAYNLSAGKSLFLITFCYIFLQMLLCAFCSFKIRNIPENLGEAKRIAFSMYIFLFSIVAYHPVEFSMDGWYVTVVDCVTTLLSAYGFLGCIFLPKIYVIIFRPDLNNLGKLRQEVTQYSLASRPARVNPKNSSAGT
ncbi:extracellular calcium-sensing receptor-like [Oculina patagonica]